jgi:hypothetical protein
MSITCRIARRVDAAAFATIAFNKTMDREVAQVVANELNRAADNRQPPSTRLASVLMAEILLRRAGAVL